VTDGDGVADAACDDEPLAIFDGEPDREPASVRVGVCVAPPLADAVAVALPVGVTVRTTVPEFRRDADGVGVVMPRDGDTLCEPRIDALRMPLADALRVTLVDGVSDVEWLGDALTRADADAQTLTRADTLCDTVVDTLDESDCVIEGDADTVVDKDVVTETRALADSRPVGVAAWRRS
jgi:hypothetical protein